jgi:peptidoglycan/xylan/chitin deacetylase (PgdA/CDA1 family)
MNIQRRDLHVRGLHVRGLRREVLRFFSIIQAYGITTKKMRRNIRVFEEILDKHSCRAIFPITAMTLKRHSKILQGVHRIEFAIHGLVHNDYSLLSLSEQTAQIREAIRIFEDAGINPLGFRGPYLGYDENTLLALNDAGLIYDSNDSILWEVIDAALVKHKDSLNRLFEMYKSKRSEECLSLPYVHNGIVRIPVSLPDDQIITDFLDVKNTEERIAEIWKDILAKSYERGELFTLQLHPERIRRCVSGLDMVLSEARSRNPVIWIAQLREIAEWWKERSKFCMEIKEKNNKYVVNVDCPEDATILVKNLETKLARDWYGGYKIMDANAFVVKSRFPPFIGVSPNVPESLVTFLEGEGFYVEESTAKNKFKIYFDFCHNDFEEGAKLSMIRKIDGSDAPLVRIWRWPHGARSAISITGDIDAMSIWDYVNI